MREITIRLDDDLLDFIDRHANGDRDTYLSTLLTQYRRWSTQQEIIRALQTDTQDPDYQAEMTLWDSVAGDGIDIRELAVQ
ncbi:MULTISPECIES: type II toxin-antitoxin system MazE family antitoxin [Leptolyngbya]|uniref:type II toxin-antitoxin system MazE family antitoxin n=1 Tax=Leptolyngbya TaxID=47251 RepID=UPI0016842237|nr:CopG family transcriptional regulator [Leptolyngbya sp. FACHB-1624]MBD1859643.1 CopG family transcriptional regulator [Leptolyngbya sp. FACHB-1624]